MFRYGKANGYMAIALAVLCVVPLIETIVVFPQLSDTVVIGFNAAQETAREGSRWYLALLPLLSLALGVASLLSGFNRAGGNGESATVAALTFRRYVRNGLVTVVIFNFANIYLLSMALTGQILPF